MKFPFEHPHPRFPYSRLQLDDWVKLHMPTTIEMTDRQYCHLADLMSYNPKEYRGIPIKFVNAPKADFSTG